MESWGYDDTPLWTQADFRDALQWSGTYIQTLVENGTITPQRRTLRGVPVFEDAYARWALKNEPMLVRRMSELGAMLE